MDELIDHVSWIRTPVRIWLHAPTSAAHTLTMQWLRDGVQPRPQPGSLVKVSAEHELVLECTLTDVIRREDAHWS
jgi:hypothetical protein